MPLIRDDVPAPSVRGVADMLGRAGALIYPPVALLAFATAAMCALPLLSTPQFDAVSAASLAGIGVVLLLSARFGHPVLNLVTTAAYLGVPGLVVGDMGVGGYMAERAGRRDMGDPVRVFLFTAARLVAMLVTAAARGIAGRPSKGRRSA